MDKELYEKLHGGKLYICDDENFMKEQAKALKKLYEYNATNPDEGGKADKSFKRNV